MAPSVAVRIPALAAKELMVVPFVTYTKLLKGAHVSWRPTTCCACWRL